MKLNVACFAIAAAIVAHHFISRTVEGFGTYPSYYAARAACRDWSKKGEVRSCDVYSEDKAAQRHWYGYVNDDYL